MEEKDELLWKIHQHRDKFPDSTITRINSDIDTPIEELRIISLKCEIEELKFCYFISLQIKQININGRTRSLPMLFT